MWRGCGLEQQEAHHRPGVVERQRVGLDDRHHALHGQAVELQRTQRAQFGDEGLVAPRRVSRHAPPPAGRAHDRRMVWCGIPRLHEDLALFDEAVSAIEGQRLHLGVEHDCWAGDGGQPRSPAPGAPRPPMPRPRATPRPPPCGRLCPSGSRRPVATTSPPAPLATAWRLSGSNSSSSISAGHALLHHEHLHAQRHTRAAPPSSRRSRCGRPSRHCHSRISTFVPGAGTRSNSSMISRLRMRTQPCDSGTPIGWSSPVPWM